jgi:translation initiation factor eIF-2B subunit alpha
MNGQDREILYQLFRDHLHVRGTSQTTRIALQSFITSLRQLKCPFQDIRGQVEALTHTIKNGEPRVAPLINLIVSCEKEFAERKIFENSTAEQVVANAARIVEDHIQRLEESTRRLVHIGVDCIKKGDVVMLHSFSRPILEMFSHAKKRGTDFDVLILRQAFVKTKQVIKYMESEHFAYTVIPEYNVSHFVDKATKLFLGAIAITADGKALCSMGSNGIASIAHIAGLPVYLFVSSLKFSSEKSTEQHIHEKTEQLTEGGVVFTQISHSHEIVDLELITHLVTEQGEMDRREISPRGGIPIGMFANK